MQDGGKMLDEGNIQNGAGGATRGGHEITKRVFLLAFLIALVLIPLYLVHDLVMERYDRSQSVADEVASQWGQQQLIAGPVVTVPYLVHVQAQTDGTKVEQTERRYANFLPDSLAITATAKTEKRYKSIYELLVYAADIQLAGRLPPPSFAGIHVPPADILWNEATVAIGISDMSGIRQLTLKLDGKALNPAPGMLRNQLFAGGAHASLQSVSTETAHDFAIDIQLNGSGQLQFLPMGNETTVELTADWPHPGFTGNFLPAERQIDARGFTARWKVSALARSYPQIWSSDQLDFNQVNDGRLGVVLTLPGDAYQQIDRIVKYGMLVIGLTFTTIFVVDLLKSARTHFVQYLLVGAALCLFYLLALSLAEQIRFVYAYTLASVVDIGMIALYLARTVSRFTGLLVGAALCVVYGYMYMLLQMEDYVLLSGTFGLFLALGLVMYATRNVDWFAIGQRLEPSPEPGNGAAADEGMMAS
jgi:inner membrane protein